MGKVLIIDDENQLRGLLARIIGLEGYEVIQADSCKAGLKQVEQQNPDVIICDVRLPDGSGVDLITEMKRLGPLTEIILLTVHGNIPDGVQAIKNGAFDYITKGDDNNKIIPLISRAVEKAKMNVRLEKLEKKVGQMYSFDSILGESKALKEAVLLAQKVSVTDVPVLLTGETGTGKELFAQSIHNSSPRKNHPFVAINCSALPENLLESELFGYVEGAFTGASKGGKMGFFELAHKGTIFLDEIGDVSPNLQSRLLRVLQEREVVRLGSDTVIPVDVRVISATNKNLKEEVANGRFRQDLLYRLDVLELNLPPLRNREQDALFLLSQLISYEHERTGCILTGLSEEGASLITQYPWPGNIREMRNFCQRLSILTQNPLATPADILKVLPDAAAALTPNGPKKTDRSTPGDAPVYSLYDEREEILKALYTFHNSRTKTAEFLGIDKSTLWRKMKKYHILLP